MPEEGPRSFLAKRPRPREVLLEMFRGRISAKCIACKNNKPGMSSYQSTQYVHHRWHVRNDCDSEGIPAQRALIATGGVSFKSHQCSLRGTPKSF